MAVDLYSREEFLTDWARQLKCANDPWSIAVHLINVNRNYSTAMATCFGLSWMQHKEYLQRATKYFQENWNPASDVATIEWLTAFVEHYTVEVEKYPEGA